MQSQQNEERLSDLIEAITAIASMDFSRKLEVSGKEDLLDIVSLGFNMLSEALEHTVVSKQRLEESEKKYKMLFSKANDIILLIKGTRIIDFNEQAVRGFGYTADELKNMDIKKLMPVHQKDGRSSKNLIKEMMKASLEKGGILKKIQKIKKDKTLFEVEVNLGYLDLNGQQYFQAIIRDISEQVKTEQKVQAHLGELEKINQELDQFAYIVSHDLKAPLRGINALANFIEEDIAEGEYDDVSENLGLLKNRINRMGNLITGILEFSRAGRSKEEITKFDFGQLIHETIELIAPSSKVQIEIVDEMPTVKTIKISLQQILQNLLSNAIKYNDKTITKIWVGCQEKANVYIFSIKDNGPGIPLVHQEKIFEIFQTLQPRDRVESTGVGLSIVRKNVQGLGGKVWVESKEGQGATFFFSLPKKV